MGRIHIILNAILNKAGKINHHNLHKIECKYPNCYNYLLNYYTDSSCIEETINRIKYNIEIRPVCNYCGGYVKWQGKNKYAAHCCTRCSSLDKTVQEKVENTCLKRYGVHRPAQLETNVFKTNNPLKNDSIKNKVKNTCVEKYGVEYAWNNATQKQTCLDKYGVDNVFKSDVIKEKCKQTKKLLYDDEYYNNREKSKQTCLKKYNVDNYSKTPHFYRLIDWDKRQQKTNETKAKNNSFNKSKPEDDLYIILKEKYKDVIRQYKDNRYPFNCDFYIPSLDLFIEYQGSQFHQGHPFNENDKNDINILNILKEKANNSNRHKECKLSQYDKIIETWTIYDIKKRNTAKKNNLNYLEVWPSDSINDIIKKIEDYL